MRGHPRLIPAAAPFALAAAALVSATGGLLLPPQIVYALMREGGLVESTTVLLYAVAIAGVIGARIDALHASDRLALGYVLVACIGREMSVRKHLLNAELAGYCYNPLQTKWLLAVLLVLLGAAVVWLGMRCLGAVRRRGLHPRDPLAVTLALVVVAAVLSQLFDRAPGLLGGAAAIGPRGAGVFLALEETLEMMLPLLVLVAMAQASDDRAGLRSTQRPLAAD